jgi:tetratricopeptide (TPR) repeat protein
MNEGDEHVTAGEIDRALEEYRRAEELLPGRSEPIFWHAVTLVSEGMVEEALPLFARAYELHPAWRELVPRIVAVGLLPDDPALVERIIGAGR